MRNGIVGTLVTVAALGAASTASAAARYGGTAVVGPYLAAPSLGILLGDDGSISARAATAFRCHKVDYDGYIVRLRGAASGAAFTAAGHTRIGGLGRVNVTVTGTFDGAAASGRLKLSVKGCKGYTRPFALRAASAPAGPPVMPPAKAAMFGTTSQSAGTIPLPVALRVTKNGKLTADWEALAVCGNRGGPIRIPVVNVTPFTKIRSDGSFSRSEKYTIRYTDGSHDVFHVTFSGRFVAGGATGTLRARVQYTDSRHRLRIPCLSGTQHWSATV